MLNIIQIKCPHCSRGVTGNPSRCPCCDRWLIGDPEWRHRRMVRQYQVFVASLASLAAALWALAVLIR